MKGKKTGGRKIGTPNKATNVNRAYLSSLLDSQHTNIVAALEEVYKTDKKGFIQLVFKLIEFTIPKLEPMPLIEENKEQPTLMFKIRNNEITIPGSK